MNPSVVEQLLELAGRRTQGDWEAQTQKLERGVTATAVVCSEDGHVVAPCIPGDAAFIAAAVNLVEPLARDWQRQRDELEFAARHANHLPRTGRNEAGDEILVGGCIPGCPGCRTEAALAAVSGEPDE